MVEVENTEVTNTSDQRINTDNWQVWSLLTPGLGSCRRIQMCLYKRASTQSGARGYRSSRRKPRFPSALSIAFFTAPSLTYLNQYPRAHSQLTDNLNENSLVSSLSSVSLLFVAFLAFVGFDAFRSFCRFRRFWCLSCLSYFRCFRCFRCFRSLSCFSFL